MVVTEVVVTEVVVTEVVVEGSTVRDQQRNSGPGIGIVVLASLSGATQKQEESAIEKGVKHTSALGLVTLQWPVSRSYCQCPGLSSDRSRNH